MTPAQKTALGNELRNDPKGKGYAQHMPDAPGMVAELLNGLTETGLGPLRTTTAKAWAASGPYSRIIDACQKAVPPALDHPCRASCLVIRDTFAAGDVIHIEEPEVQAMLVAWVQTSICTQAESDDLYRRAQQPVSRAQALGLGVVTEEQVRQAWQS